MKQSLVNPDEEELLKDLISVEDLEVKDKPIISHNV